MKLREKQVLHKNQLKVNIPKKKINTFAHGEFNKNDIANEESIKLKIKKGQDIFERGFKLEKIDIDEKFPEYILKNKEYFKDWIV